MRGSRWRTLALGALLLGLLGVERPPGLGDVVASSGPAVSSAPMSTVGG